ncbi:hypothetical protein ECDEC14D_2115 [Escherichia coli DEC14D]|nr:hypothetical protein ECDEC14D_2115 [Escherichia coli DEC14D]
MMLIVRCYAVASSQAYGCGVLWADKALAPHPPTVNRIIRSH